MNPVPSEGGRSETSAAKPKLLVVELWGLGDLAIATPFLQAARQNFDITLLAKPFVAELRERLWPDIKFVSFSAPWTVFKKKYHLWRWPIGEMLRLRKSLGAERFDYGLSARWDPRDHVLLNALGVRHRLGFPRIKSGFFLTHKLERPNPLAHHYEYWRAAGRALGVQLPPREKLTVPARAFKETVLVHTGARLPARVWPLQNFQQVVRRLRAEGRTVQIACDPDQLPWWREVGREDVVCPATVRELLAILDNSGVFIGNCSGPGHLAATIGVPTYTLFGPSLLEWFAPLHPAAEWFEGKACPYKPCSDYCRLATPECLWKVSPDEVWPHIHGFVRRHLSAARALAV